MFDIGAGELILIVIAILLLFGPQKLPEIAQMMGKGMKKMKEAQSTLNDQMKNLKDEMKIDLNEDIKPLMSLKRDQIIENATKIFENQVDKEEKKQEPKNDNL